MLANMIQGILIVAIEVLCCKIFLESFLEKRKFKKDFFGALLLLLLTAVIYIGTLFLTDYFLLKEVFVTAAISVLMKLYFQAEWKKEIILSVLYVGLLLCVDCVAVLLIPHILPEKILSRLSLPMESTLFALICKMVLFGIVCLLRKTWGKAGSGRDFTTQEWIRFLYFPIFTIGTISILMINFDMLEGAPQQNFLLIIAFGLVFMNFIVFQLMHDVIEREQKLKENKLFQEKVRHQTTLYHSISENAERQRKWIHEYKNQMNCIDGLLNAGQIDDARQYVNKITGTIHQTFESIDTNHVIVNAILNSKYAEAIEKDILMIFKINDLSRLSLSDEDIVTILSNLLSNAIEACERVDGNRQIKVKFTDDSEKTVLAVKNTYASIKKDSANGYETLKEDKRMHGIGITNIKETVKKYHGTCFISDENHEFLFSIQIPHSSEAYR